jgi:hypothetical protein
MGYQKPSITVVGSIADLTLGDNDRRRPRHPKPPHNGVS